MNFGLSKAVNPIKKFQTPRWID